jgi:hypothetical protein
MAPRFRIVAVYPLSVQAVLFLGDSQCTLAQKMYLFWYMAQDWDNRAITHLCAADSLGL